MNLSANKRCMARMFYLLFCLISLGLSAGCNSEKADNSEALLRKPYTGLPMEKRISAAQLTEEVKKIWIKQIDPISKQVVEIADEWDRSLADIKPDAPDDLAKKAACEKFTASHAKRKGEMQALLDKIEAEVVKIRANLWEIAAEEDIPYVTFPLERMPLHGRRSK